MASLGAHFSVLIPGISALLCLIEGAVDSDLRFLPNTRRDPVLDTKRLQWSRERPKHVYHASLRGLGILGRFLLV